MENTEVWDSDFKNAFPEFSISPSGSYSSFTLIVLETENFGVTTLGTGGVLGSLENILSAISSIFSLFVTGSFGIVFSELFFAKARTKITLFIISFCNLLVNRDLPSSFLCSSSSDFNEFNFPTYAVTPTQSDRYNLQTETILN